MKEIKFRTIHGLERDLSDILIPANIILSALDTKDGTKGLIADITKISSSSAFVWKDVLLAGMKHNNYTSTHPLKTSEDFDYAMEVRHILKNDVKDETISCDNDIADIFCDIADSIIWAGVPYESMGAYRDFKKYFEELRTSDGKKFSEKPKVK